MYSRIAFQKEAKFWLLDYQASEFLLLNELFARTARKEACIYCIRQLLHAVVFRSPSQR